MTCCNPTLKFEQRNDTNRTNMVEQELRASSTKQKDGTYLTQFIVPDMSCIGCITKIERELSSLPWVDHVRANLTLKTVSVTWQKQHARGQDLSDKISALGFTNHVQHSSDKVETHEKNKSNQLLLALSVAGFAAANIMLLSVSVWSGADPETTQLFHLISGIIALPTIAFAGRPFFTSALNALKNKHLNMDVPISLAIILAFAMSLYESISGGGEAYFDASVMLLFFLLIGRYLDSLMRQKARGAAERLSTLSAKSGIAIEADGTLTRVPLQDIEEGMTLRIFAGERFPVNGEIISGTSDIDRAHITGESETCHASPGDMIEAGALNLTGSVDIKAVTNAQDSFLGEMRQMIEAAENSKSKYVRIADKMATLYAPAVHSIAFLTFIGWMIASGGDWKQSIYTAIAVLIVTCPCALGLAVPVAHVVGANRLLNHGILMRDGTALERMAQIDHVVFDKTGTLTLAETTVLQVSKNISKHSRLLKTVTANTSHPMAKAVHVYLDAPQALQVDKVNEVPGLGLEVTHNDKRYRLGKRTFVREIAKDLPKTNKEYSVWFAKEGGKAIGFKVADQIRTDAKATIHKLTEDNLSVEMLSGDHKSKVQTLANQLGITKYRYEQSPADKVKYLHALRQNTSKVLMVGDGINDAPALAEGYVSMVPASASDIGRHVADFIFTRQSLSAVSLAYSVAKRTKTVVQQNFALALGYNCIAVPITITGYVSPLIAAVSMSASSILVVANSMRVGIENKDKEVKEDVEQSQLAPLSKLQEQQI